MLPKIPDDIYENRCRYCIHFIAGKENREIKPNEVNRNIDNPCVCKVQSIAGYKYQEHNGDYSEFWYVPYDDGECRTFAPNFGYPICRYCEYFAPFNKELEYCKIKPTNRKTALIGRMYDGEFWKYGYMICDKWKMGELGRHKAIEKVAEGRLPQCFDPTTFKLLLPAKENMVAEKWKEIIDNQKSEILRAEAEQREKEKTDDNGQYKIF